MKMSSKRKRALRTLVLGLLATVALLWGAAELVGVPWGNLASLLISAFLGVAVLIITAGVLVGLFKLLAKLLKKN
jgi:hypothetical protein